MALGERVQRFLMVIANVGGAGGVFRQGFAGHQQQGFVRVLQNMHRLQLAVHLLAPITGGADHPVVQTAFILFRLHRRGEPGRVVPGVGMHAQHRAGGMANQQPVAGREQVAAQPAFLAGVHHAEHRAAVADRVPQRLFAVPGGDDALVHLVVAAQRVDAFVPGLSNLFLRRLPPFLVQAHRPAHRRRVAVDHHRQRQAGGARQLQALGQRRLRRFQIAVEKNQNTVTVHSIAHDQASTPRRPLPHSVSRSRISTSRPSTHRVFCC